MLYHTQELEFDLPDEFNDRSINIFSLDPNGPSEISLVLTRERSEPLETLQGFSSRQVTALGKALPMFRLLERVERQVCGTLAITIECSWVSPEAPMHQYIVCFAAPDVPGLVLSLTATSRQKIRQEWQDRLETLIASIRPRT